MIYETIYKNLIHKRHLETPQGYTEIHHIIPKSFNGNDCADNLVVLSAREHYLAHYLLLKMQTPNSKKYFSALKAFLMMQCDNGTGLRYIPAHKFKLLKEIDSKRKSISYIGSGNSQFGTIWICNPKTLENKKIKKCEIIPDGFILGRNKFSDSYKKEHICKKNKTIICLTCGKSFHSYDANRKFCSVVCSRLYLRGERVSKSLTMDQVVEIRKLLNEKKSLRVIANIFSVSYVAISKIKNNHSWKM